MDHDDNSFPFDEFRQIVGGSNWVIARRSPHIVARYDSDVVCLSQQKYKNAERLARLARTNGYD
jgi:hypothetical protein